MGNRGQKRTETVDEFPSDKRACSSLEFRPSTSNSSVQTPMSPNREAHDGDMDTSSSASGSTRSEGDGEKDSAYGSCDSDNSFRDYHRRRSYGDHAKFENVLSNLSKEVDQSGQLAALTELCELLSFCADSSLSSWMADSYSPVLVKLARQESNPDIMLLAVRAITYLCDVHPRSSAFLVRHDAVPALCQRLMAIEFLDVAEQCLQALEKISHEQPLACLQSGAIMAVLNYMDFFSTSVQRVALSTVVNICKKLPSGSPSPFMEAVPILCNLLQYEDRQLVENGATCLMKIVDSVCRSPDMLDELCKYGFVRQAMHLIHLNSQTTVSQSTHFGLIGSLVKMTSGSNLAFKTLYELDIIHVLKEVISTYNLSHGAPSTLKVDEHSNQVHEVLKLLNELLPVIAGEQDIELPSEKEAFLMNRPDLLHKFGLDLLPLLIQAVNSGANLYVCYGCLAVINKLVYFSKSDILLEVLRSVNISSFLAGVFTRKDHHVLIFALQIIDTILRKLSDAFLNSFVKEGVFFAIDALLSPEKCSQYMFPEFNSMYLSSDASQKSASRDIQSCLCFALDTGQASSAPEKGPCKLEKDTVQNLAKHIKTNYLPTELMNPENELTSVLQKLKSLSTSLIDLVNISKNDLASTLHEEEFHHILHKIMLELNGKDPISTFEFIESGIVNSLVNYLSTGQYLRGAGYDLYSVEKRFEMLGRHFLSAADPPLEASPLSALIGRLQSALSSVENFPVVLFDTSKLRNSYATVPYRRCTPYPCLKVQFVKGEDDTYLGDFSGGVVNVDPFSPIDAIEAYLWEKVGADRTLHVQLPSKSWKEKKSAPPHLPSDSSPSHSKSPDLMDSDRVSVSGKEEVQELHNSPLATAGEKANSITNSADLGPHYERRSSAEEASIGSDSPSSTGSEDESPKFSLYLEGQPLDRALTLYQAVLQQQIKREADVVTNTNLWTEVHKLTYRSVKKSSAEHHHHCTHSPSPSVKTGTWWKYTPFFSGILVSEVVDVEKSNPVYDILTLLKSLEGMNRLRFHLMSRERIFAFAEGRTNDLDNLRIAVSNVPKNEFVNTKLTEKLEQQMQDPLALFAGGMPSWCEQLLASCPFLFTFEARCKYFHLSALGQPHPSSHSNIRAVSVRHQSNNSILPRKKFLVHRDRILDSAAQMMDCHARQRVIIEVEYDEEVGTGLGPTLEFYTLVSREFQKNGLGMWREDHLSLGYRDSLETGDSGSLVPRFGLFPRPWSPAASTSSSKEFSEVMKKFVLLGQIVAKALQDGRVLDLPFSKAFYKIILGRELTIYDIPAFDPELGRALLEFQALVERKRFLESICKEKPTVNFDMRSQNACIVDLCLDFTVPGFPDYIPESSSDSKMVNMFNLEEYVSIIVDATVKSGISRQIEALKSGFTQVFPIKHLEIFTEEELELLLCGERELWNSSDLLDHIKFDHGYTASSPPVINLLEIIQEFNSEQQRGFLQFVTGAPRLPPGGLASLKPKLTIVRKNFSISPDADLPSVMTCANYLKLPPYSSKDRMKEKLLYAITEGQGSFHLS